MKSFLSISRMKEYILGNIRFSWIISYIIILLLPLAINSFLYINAYNTISSQAQDSQKSAVVHLSANMDNEFSRIDEFASQISFDVDVNYLLNASGLESFKQSYSTASRIYNLHETLALNLPSNDFISDYYIFSTKNNLVFHNSGVNEISSYKLLPNNKTGILYEACKQLDTSKLQIFPLDSPNGESYTVLLYPLPYTYMPKGYLTVLLDNNDLNAHMQGLYSQENSEIYLMDDNNNALNGIGTPKEGKKYLKYSSDSSVLPLQYICTLPESVATADLIYLRHALWICAFCCLLGGGILISVLTRYNYSPWLKLMNTIQNHSGTAISGTNNEFKIVLNALTEIYQEKATIEEVFQRQNKTLYSYYISRMMKGNIEAETIEETILSNMEQMFQLHHYTLLLSLTDVKDTWTEEHTDLIKDAYLSFFETQIVHRLQEYLGASFSIIFADVYDYTACVIGMPDSETDIWQVKVSGAMEQITRDLSKTMDIQYYFASSNLHHSITEMSTAYEEAFTAISLSVMNQEKNHVFYEDMDDRDSGNYTYPTRSEQALINLIQLGDSVEASELIQTLLADISHQFPSLETAKCMAADILCSVTKAFSHLPDDRREKIQGDYYSAIEGFMLANSYKKLTQKLLEAVSIISDAFRNSGTVISPQSTWIPLIEEQLESNLFDENLNVMFIAHKLGISAKYLSSLYMDAKGISIVDTMHQKRIEVFKDLIRNKQMNISEAASAVGYNSIATLNRWVKKYEGVTPGQLKNM